MSCTACLTAMALWTLDRMCLFDVMGFVFTSPPDCVQLPVRLRLVARHFAWEIHLTLLLYFDIWSSTIAYFHSTLPM